MTENATSPINTNTNTKLTLCYVGIILALSMSALSLYLNPNFTHMQDLLTNKTANVGENVIKDEYHVPSLPALQADNNNNLLQAINLLYAAEFSFKVMQDKAQTMQILSLVHLVMGNNLLVELKDLEEELAKVHFIDKAQLLAGLLDFKEFYEKQAEQGKFSNKVFAKVIRFENESSASKQSQILEAIHNLQVNIENGKNQNLSLKITNIINLAGELDPELGKKSQDLQQFLVIENSVTFAKVFEVLYQQLGLRK